MTDIVLRELYKRAKRGEKVAMKSDGGGLSFEAGRYWRFTFSFAGKKKRLALGVYPDVSLKMARMARDRARELLAQGINPCEQKKQDKAKARRLEQESRLTFEVVARENTDGKFEKSLEVAQSALEEHPDVTAIMCGNDQIAVGAQTAVNLLGLDNVIIYGVDGSPDIKKELLKSDTQIAGTAAQSPINMGKTAVEVALAILNGEDYEKENYVEIIDMITKDNVEMYGADGWQ